MKIHSKEERYYSSESFCGGHKTSGEIVNGIGKKNRWSNKDCGPSFPDLFNYGKHANTHPLSLCLCIYVCVCIHVGVYGFTWAWKQKVKPQVSFLSHQTFYSLTGSLTGPELLSRLGWLASKPQGSSSPGLRLSAHNTTPSLFTVSSGGWTQGLMLVRQSPEAIFSNKLPYESKLCNNIFWTSITPSTPQGELRYLLSLSDKGMLSSQCLWPFQWQQRARGLDLKSCPPLAPSSSFPASYPGYVKMYPCLRVDCQEPVHWAPCQR